MNSRPPAASCQHVGYIVSLCNETAAKGMPSVVGTGVTCYAESSAGFSSCLLLFSKSAVSTSNIHQSLAASRSDRKRVCRSSAGK